jgi:signal transduction histidine kinase
MLVAQRPYQRQQGLVFSSGIEAKDAFPPDSPVSVSEHPDKRLDTHEQPAQGAKRSQSRLGFRVVQQIGEHRDCPLLADLLEMALFDTKDMAVTTQTFPVLELFVTLADMFTLRAKEKGLALEWIAPSMLPMLLGDFRRFRQILFQLMGSGLKFTE